MKLRLKRWVKVVLYISFLFITILVIKDMFTKKTVVITEGKNYTCYGGVIQVCAGESYDYK